MRSGVLTPRRKSRRTPSRIPPQRTALVLGVPCASIARQSGPTHAARECSGLRFQLGPTLGSQLGSSGARRPFFVVPPISRDQLALFHSVQRLEQGRHRPRSPHRWTAPQASSVDFEAVHRAPREGLQNENIQRAFQQGHRGPSRSRYLHDYTPRHLARKRWLRLERHETKYSPRYSLCYSAPGPIRTADLAFRKRLLYPPELRGR